MEAAGEFASHLGLAFQIRDDILDKIGDAETLGKAVGVDEGKNTFLRLYGMDTCQALVRQHTEKALGALSVFPERQWMTELAGWLTDRTY